VAPNEEQPFESPVGALVGELQTGGAPQPVLDIITKPPPH